jgi:hypothetical protein
MDKGSVLNIIKRVYHGCMEWIDIQYSLSRRKQPDLKPEKIELPIKEITGKDSDKKVNIKALNDLRKAVMEAQYFDQIPKTYTPYQILSFSEYALWFIRAEFHAQAGTVKNENPRPRTASYFNYLISPDAPFIDFPKFKAAFRELNFTIRNREPFEKIAGNFHKAAKEIVELWNTKIFKIMSSKESHAHSEMVRVEFKAEGVGHSWWVDEDLFETKPHFFFLNQDFAQFAAAVANLIGDEVLNKRHVSVKMERRIFLKDFIECVHVMLDEEIKADTKDGNRSEAPYRNAMWRWFRQLKYKTEREALKGPGHIDLKVYTDDDELKVVEFKGWWNHKKKTVVQQTCNYLTDFEGDGYIFMINHTKTNIEEAYKLIVRDRATGYKQNSWKPHKVAAFVYFTSIHKHRAKEKLIYHFIYNA